MRRSVISVVNQKGGVGKTTTTVNLTAYLAARGLKILLIDLDPQGNASSGLGLRPQNLTNGLYEALMGNKELSEVIYDLPHVMDNLYIVPATMNLAGANVELISVAEREYQLKRVVDSVRDRFDYILVDSPPSLGILAVNGLVASDEVLIPVQAEYYALEGLGQLLSTIDLVKDNLQDNLEVLGAVLTMHDVRTNLSEAVLKELYRHFPRKIFRTVIPRNVRLAEAPSHGKTILQYDPSSRGGIAYQRLAEEFLSVMAYKEGKQAVG